MSGDEERISRLERRLERERRARMEAERLLEEKSGELFEVNQELEKLLESQGRTLQKYRDAMSRLVDALLSSGDDHEGNISHLMDEGRILLGATAGTILEVEGVQDQIKKKLSWSFGSALPEAARLQGLQVQDLEEWRMDEVSYLAIPLEIGKRRVGVILMCLGVENALDELGRMVAGFVATLVAADLERSEARSEIKLKEQRYESLFHASVDSILIVDFEGRIRDVSESALRMFGLSRGSMMDAELHPFVDQDSLKRSAGAFRQVKEVGRCHFEADLLRSDGSKFPAELVGNSFEIGGEKRVYVIARDLTQRKKNQAEVLERERKFRAVFEQSQDGIVLHDLSGSVIDVNETLCKLLGYTRSELRGRHLSELHPQESLAICRRSMEEVSAQGRSRFECQFARKDGSTFVAEVWANSFESGGDCLVQGIVRDVTEQRRREREIQEAMEAAELANETKSVFLATMSHEIRTPLNGILGFADLLEQSGMADEQRNSVEMIRKSGDVLLGLINNILDFSRAESGRILVSKEKIDPVLFLKETVELHRGVANGKDLALSVEIGDGIPDQIEAAKTQLRQVIMNLIGNAVKFTDEGSVVVSLNLPTPKILRFEVRDTGIGFPKGDEEKLFEAFFQVDLSSTRRHGGTGLGLAICRRLVEEMGGKIYATHEPAGGSRFVVDLPLREVSQKEIKASAEPVNQMSLSGGGMVVLVVEDHPVNLKLLRMMLEKLGFQVVTAENGRIALEVLQEREDIELILMDMRMPEMDGLEATQRIRSGEAGESARELPVVAVTANAMEADREACRKVGMDHYLSKPINGRELEKVLLNAILPDHGSGI